MKQLNNVMSYFDKQLIMCTMLHWEDIISSFFR